MKKSIYFAVQGENSSPWPRLATGFGFTPAGDWRQLPPPKAEALAVDDRFWPSSEGLRAAIRFLRSWDGWILWDFERPVSAHLISLLEQLGDRETVVPPAYASAPHQAVLVGPYVPGLRFDRWLSRQRERYGAIVIDAAPIRHICSPGEALGRLDGAPPEHGVFSPGARCLYRRSEEGFAYWDSRETLLGRCRAAEAPSIILAVEWAALQSDPEAPAP